MNLCIAELDYYLLINVMKKKKKQNKNVLSVLIVTSAAETTYKVTFKYFLGSFMFFLYVIACAYIT